ncbi:MAG: flagellar hook-basal body complex protein FliE [Candidatus Kapaibacteriota bacterium]
MIVNEMDASKQFLPKVQQKLQNNPINTKDVTFVDTLKTLVTDVNSQQVEAADATEKLIKGEPVDIHDVMISAEKAKTSFQLLMELRNKGLDLYREVLRMQI